MAQSRPVARLDDGTTGRSLTFPRARALILARSPDEVPDALAAAEAAARGGAWAVGHIAYEAAAGLDPDAAVRVPDPRHTLVRFAVCDEALVDEPWPEDLGAFRADPWRLDCTDEAWLERIARVHDAIRRGDTYQVNLTARMRGRVTGDLLAAQRALVTAQHGAYSAYLDTGDRSILSASPERFVTWRDGVLTTTPMKGTAPRSKDPVEDARLRAALLASPKERAENVMIVDLLRNDLSRVCADGSVRVERLLECESYPTVHQVTSTISCTPRPDLTLAGMLGALFPCGSITGAPKLSTMQVIAALEDSPRDVYCGAIGVLAPGEEMDASFSVAIRTAVVDHADGRAVYGVGGGITWDSVAAAELEEVRVKSRVLEALTESTP